MLLLTQQRFADSNSGNSETALADTDIIPLQKGSGGRDGHVTYALIKALIGAGYLSKVVYDPDDDGVVAKADALSYQGARYMFQDSSQIRIGWNDTSECKIEIKNGSIYFYSDLTNTDGRGVATRIYHNASAVMTELQMSDYIKIDGTIQMASGYSPAVAQDVATKTYVDNKVAQLSTTYVVADLTALYAVSNILVGDRGIVTSDATSANNGEYICNTANVTPPSTSANWTKVESSGDLLSDGSVPMQGGYAPTSGQDICTVTYANDADTALKTSYIDPLKTSYETFTWALPGSVTTADLVAMAIMVPAGETWYVNRCRRFCASGAGEMSLLDDGSPITGFSLITITTSQQTVAPTAVAIADGSKLVPDISDATAMVDVTITVEIKKVRT